MRCKVKNNILQDKINLRRGGRWNNEGERAEITKISGNFAGENDIVCWIRMNIFMASEL